MKRKSLKQKTDERVQYTATLEKSLTPNEAKPRLIEEFNKLPNAIFWEIDEKFNIDPFKGSMVAGIKPIRKSIQYNFSANHFMPFSTTKDEILSQMVIVDVLNMEGDTLKEKENAYLRYCINDRDYLLKKSRCEALGILYIADFRLARIYEKIHSL